MDVEAPSRRDPHTLAIQLSPGRVSVSYLSSLLRLVQATLREVARSNEATRGLLEQSPQTPLVLSGISNDGLLTLQLAFANPSDSSLVTELSSSTFDALLDRFTDFVKTLPQPGLWGGAARGPRQRDFESDLARRMDQLYRELRRSRKAAMRFGGRSVEIEGDRMEIV